MAYSDARSESVASLARIKDTYENEARIWFAYAQKASSEKEFREALNNAHWHRSKVAELRKEIEKRLARGEALHGQVA